MVDALIALHGQEPPPEAELPHRTVSDELAWWNDYLAWSADGDEPVSALARALAWCAEHRPATEPPAGMLWGDVRLGNVVFTDDGAIAAVLDWEMATVGAPEHDLAWWWALEAMQDDLAGGRGAGFPTIADAAGPLRGRLGPPAPGPGLVRDVRPPPQRRRPHPHRPAPAASGGPRSGCRWTTTPCSTTWPAASG